MTAEATIDTLSEQSSVDPESLSNTTESSESATPSPSEPHENTAPTTERVQDEWEPLRAKMRSKETVQARVVKWQRNGLEMEIQGVGTNGTNVMAFMPNDNIDRDPNRNIANYFGKTLPVRITNVRPKVGGADITVSHRAILEDEIRNAGKEAIKNFNVGDIVDVKVKTFSKDNVVVDLGAGIDAVIRLRDLAWQHIEHPYEVIKRGDSVKAKILSLDRGRRQVRLGVKQLTEDPELAKFSEYEPGQTHTVKVTTIGNFGAEVALPNGLIAFLPMSEIAWHRIGSVAEVLNIGDELEVKLLTVTPDDRRITVSRKQLVEDPIRLIENTFKPGTDHNGTIKEVNRGGVVVSLEHGAEGFVPRRELSHDRIERLEDVFKAGKPIEGLRVIEFDRGRRGEGRSTPRITMSLIAAEKEAQRNTLRNYRATSRASSYSLSDSLAALRDKLVQQEQQEK